MHLFHIFPSFQVGGSQRRFAALANHFAHQPLTKPVVHSIASLDGCFEAAALLDPDVRVNLLDVRRKGNFITTMLHARRLVQALRADLLVTYNWGAVEWAGLRGPVRHVHIEDGFGPEEAERQLRRRVWFRRLVLNHGSTLVLPSQTLVRLATNNWRIQRARIIHLPNGIPCQRFTLGSEASLRTTFRGEGPVIGTVAGLRKEKALDRLISAFAHVRAKQPARLVIVGEGPERASLVQLADRLGITDSVTFTGALATPEQAFAGFDIFAISSNTEQMPLSVLEAMASGLPIAATDAGDIAFMLADENRPFVVEKSADALAQAITRLLEDEVLRRRLGLANRTRAVATFDENRMFEAYQRLFLGDGEASGTGTLPEAARAQAGPSLFRH